MPMPCFFLEKWAKMRFESLPKRAFAHPAAEVSTALHCISIRVLVILSEPPGRTFVTPGAHGKILTAEGALAVVASGTTRTSGRCVVVERGRRRNLPALRQTRPDSMTASARKLLRRVMVRVTEPDAVRSRLFRSAYEPSQPVTRSARRNVAAA